MSSSHATPEARLGAELRRLRVGAGLSVRQLGRKLNRAHSSIVVYETGGRLAPVEVVEQYERFFELAPGTLGAQRERARLERLEDPRDATLDANLAGAVCPYKGLQAFEHGDAALFFGREAQVEDVVARLAMTRFAAIVGASGSGKSSFLRAGVLARVARMAADGAPTPFALLTPGEHPLDALAGAVDAATGGVTGLCAADLRADPHALGRATSGALVIAVDQLEELFTRSDEDDRHRFVDALLAAWQDPSSPVVVIVALRADFYGRVPEHPALSEAVVANQSLLGPMTAPDLRRAIELPAASAGLTLQRGLVESVLEDLAGEPGALPLLSHTLLETWKRRRRLMLTVAGYREAGSVRGAIAQTAERTLRELEPPDRPIARSIMLELTAIGEGAEPAPRRVDRAALAARADDPGRVERVVEILAGARLLTLGEDSVEVAHEALVRHWPRLHAWIEEDRAGLLTRRRLTEAAREWELLRRDSGALYRGAQLAAAREGAGGHTRLDDLEREFLAASDAAEQEAFVASRRRTRRLRGLAAGLAVLTAMVAAASLVALSERHEARRQAAHATSLLLVSAAKPLLDSRPDISLLLAFEAYRASPRVEARYALLAALRRTRSEGVLGILRGHVDPVASVAFAPDGKTVASAGEDGTVRLWDVRTRRESARLQGHMGAVTSVAFSPGGDIVASGGGDGTVRLWSIRTRAQVGKALTGHAAAVRSVAFSRDGRLLASAGDDGTIRLVDLRTRSTRVLRGHVGPVASVAFRRDGRVLASAGDDGTVRLWSPGGGTPRGVALTGHEGPVNSVAFAPSGQVLASGGDDGTVRLWDADTREQRAPAMDGHTGPVLGLAFAPDSDTLFSAGADRTVRAWNARDAVPDGGPLIGHSGAVAGVAVSHDGTVLASASFDRTLRLWRATYRQSPERGLAGRRRPVVSVALSPKGGILASGEIGGTIQLWSLKRHVQIATLTGDDRSVESLAFSPDGTILASGGADGTVRLWSVGSHDLLAELPGHSELVSSVAFSPGGRLLASGSFDATVRLWDPRTPAALSTAPPRHSEAVASVAFSRDGSLLASASFDSTVRVWDVRRRSPRTALRGHRGPVSSVAFGADSRILAAGSADGDVYLWDPLAAPPASTRLSHHVDRVTSVAFSRDGGLLASGSADKTIGLWDVRGKRFIAPLTGHRDWVTSVAFNRAGDRLASASNDGTVRIWDVRKRRQTSEFDSARPPRTGGPRGARPLGVGQGWRTAADLHRLVCQLVGNGLSRSEWIRYAFGISYRRSCP